MRCRWAVSCSCRCSLEGRRGRGMTVFANDPICVGVITHHFKGCCAALSSNSIPIAMKTGSVPRAVDDEALVNALPLLVFVDRFPRVHDLDGLALAHQAPHRRVVAL